MDATGSTHDLLLALAGRVDDDLLAWARELVAVGEDARAVELVTAGLVADGVTLPAPLRAAVVDAATTLRVELDAAAALPPAGAEPDDSTEHRFTPTPPGADERVAAAVRGLPGRLLGGARVLLSWRSTPAGAAPGPLPHPVVLVEVQPWGRPADVLAYQLSVALQRVGVLAAVEVLTADRPLSAYHTAARRHALPMDAVLAADQAVAQPRPEAPSVGWPSPASTDAGPELPAPEARATPDTVENSAPNVHDGDPDPPRPDEPHRATVMPIARPPLLSPVPLARRGPGRPRPLTPVTGFPGPLTPVPAYPPVEPAPPAGTSEAAVERTDPRPAVVPAERGQTPALTDTPMFTSMQDPLSGPLSSPMFTPSVEPAPDAGDRNGSDALFGPISPLAPDHPFHPGQSAADPSPSAGSVAGPSVPGPSVAGPSVADRWASEWASGDWAVSPSDLDGAPEDRPRNGAADLGPPPAAAAPAAPADTFDEHVGDPVRAARLDEQVSDPAGARAARHRFADELRPELRVPPPVPVPPAAPTNDAPGHRPEPDRGPAWPGDRWGGPAAAVARPVAPVPDPPDDRPELGLRPESVGRLSEADRDLLARLQAELSAGRKPRVTRRAGLTPAPVNGSAADPAGSEPDRSAPHRSEPGTNGAGRYDQRRRTDPPDPA